MPPAELLDVPTSPGQPPSTIGKRKRSDSDHRSQPNGLTPPTAIDLLGDVHVARLRASMKDLLYILRSYDTSPSVLDLALPSPDQRLPASEPATKRAKVIKPIRSSNIASRIENDEYTSLEEAREDIEAACSELLASKNANGSSTDIIARHLPTPPEDGSFQANVLLFRKLVTTLLDTESQRSSLSKQGTTKIKIEDNNQSTFKLSETNLDDAQSGKVVLTLYGNAQGPKQLFSSLQQPIRTSRQLHRHKPQILDADNLQVNAPLREDALPNLITASKIIPIQANDAVNEKERAPTIGELFAPSSAIPQLNPPKPPKQSTTRGSRVGWIDNSSLPKTGKKGTYTTQSLTTGHWLGYNSVNVPQEPSSPTAKRKQRDRALSTGEARPALSEEATAALQQAKEDALFRTAFSSFAPTHDDSMAIVPEELKNRVWWQRHGEKRFIETFAIDPALDADTSIQNVHEEQTTEDKVLQEAVDSYVPIEAESLINAEEKEKKEEQDDREVEDVLREISELLETLHSYQRIRNSILPANSRTPTANQKPSLPWLAESPTTPSAAEFDTYSILKSQLTLLIATLPPSAVAKLDGDQLEDLNIKQTINIESKNCKGVMEEHQATRYAKAAALNAGIGPTRSSSSLGQVQYSSNSQYGRTPLSQTASRSGQSTQGYYPQQQPPNRGPSMNYSQRPSSGSSQTYATPTQTASGRTTYSTYNQSRPAQPSYGGVPNGQSYQRSSSTNYNYNQQYSTPASRSQNGSTASYPPRPSSTVPASYSTPTVSTATATNYPRTSSPANTAATNKPTTITANNATRATGKQSSPATPPPPATPSQSQAHAATGPSGYHTYQTSAEQQLMLDRQKAQLALQPQARASAQAGVGAVKSEGSGEAGKEEGERKVNGVVS